MLPAQSSTVLPKRSVVKWASLATAWSGPMVLAMIKGDARKFAEQSVAEHSAPTAAEIAEADAAVGKFVPKQQPFSGKPPAWLTPVVLIVSLAGYVCIPALIAALLFRGGLVLLIAGVTFVRKDGQRASRLRVVWRALVADNCIRLGSASLPKPHQSHPKAC